MKKRVTQRQAEAALTELLVLRAAAFLASDDNRRKVQLNISPADRQRWTRIIGNYTPKVSR